MDCYVLQKMSNTEKQTAFPAKICTTNIAVIMANLANQPHITTCIVTGRHLAPEVVSRIQEVHPT